MSFQYLVLGFKPMTLKYESSSITNRPRAREHGLLGVAEERSKPRFEGTLIKDTSGFESQWAETKTHSYYLVDRGCLTA